MKHFFILIILIGLLSFNGLCQFAQFNSNIWYFGGNAGLDFNSGTPVALSNGVLNQIEGCATICDSNGNLLLYTDGVTVYNRNHQIMPNGTGLMGHISATQSSIIVPQNQHPNLFYVFTVDAVENHLANGLRYSVVDMNLDNGKGDIVLSQKNKLLYAPVPEKVTAILNTLENGYWIVTHEWGTNAFLSFKFDEFGIDTVPVVSNVGSIHEGGAYPTYAPLDGWLNAIGYLKANKLGNKIAAVRYRDKLEIFDFNRITGVVSNCISSLQIYDLNYGVEFSPNSTKLYLTLSSSTLGNYRKIYQFDLTQPQSTSNPALIATTTYDPSAIQIGPDGNVYVSEWNSSGSNHYLGRINNPDLTWPSCSYTQNAVNLGNGVAKRGLPNLYYYKGFQFITSNKNDDIDSADLDVYYNSLFQSIDILNPTNNELEVLVYNTSGLLLKKEILNANEVNTISTFELLNGIYIVRIVFDNSFITRKIAVIK